MGKLLPVEYYCFSVGCFLEKLPRIGLPRVLLVKNPPADTRDTKDAGSIPGL